MTKLKKIKPKQETFCREYVIDHNGTQAAIRAGYAKGSAKTTAYKFLNQDTYSHMQARIKELEGEAVKRCEVNIDWVITRLVRIAEDNIRNYLSYSSKKIPFVDLEGKADSYNIIDIDMKNSDDIDTWNITEIKKGKDGQFSFKLNSKENAIVKLGEYAGAFSSTIDKARTEKMRIDRERFEMEKKLKNGDKGNDLTKQLEAIKTLSEYINNPQPNRSIEDE